MYYIGVQFITLPTDHDFASLDHRTYERKRCLKPKRVADNCHLEFNSLYITTNTKTNPIMLQLFY